MNSNKCEEENLEVATFPNSNDQSTKYDIISSFEKKRSNQKLYIKSKDSIIHLGTKVVLEVQNEKDIKKLQPFLESLNRETLQREVPQGLKDETESNDENFESIDEKENANSEECNSEAQKQNLELNVDRISSNDIKLDKLQIDLNISKESNECLLTPEYFKASPCIYTSASLQSNSNQIYQGITPTTASLNSSTPVLFADSSISASASMLIPSNIHASTTKAVLEQNMVTLGNNNQMFNPTIVNSNSHIPYFNLNPNEIKNSFMQGQSSVPYSVQDSYINSPVDLKYYHSQFHNSEQFQPMLSSGNFGNVHARFPPVSSVNNSSIPTNNHVRFPPASSSISSGIPTNNHVRFPPVNSCIPASTSTTDNFSSISKRKVQASLSLPAGLSNQPLQTNNYTGEDRTSEFPRERLLRERPKHDWIPLSVNFIEERNFKLGIIPGKFYDTQNGVVVEMQNGKHYTIFIINDNHDQCDVDVFVDTHIVAKLRLDGNSSEYLDGPRYSSLKFTFLRARDAPPQAEIMFNDEGNGLIEVIFKPERKDVAQKRLRERAWSAESSGPFLRTLSETLGNLYGPKKEEHSDFNENDRYRSGSFCAGATALQGKQKDRYAELVNDIEIDENRIVILQLRLVARTDDSSELERDEPVKPLITKRPPPLPL